MKTYLRSTITQSRLHHLLILHCHKDRTDSLSLTECLQEFVDCREGRTDVFGKFKYGTAHLQGNECSQETRELHVSDLRATRE